MSRVALLLVFCLPLAASAQSLPATVVARTGQDVGGVPGATYTTIGVLPRLGVNGHVAFNSFITGTASENFGYWVGAPGNLQLAIRKNTANSGPELFSGTANVGVDANGTASLWSQAAFPAPNNENQTLWSYLPNGNGGGSTIVAQKGQTLAPGYTGGAVFTSIGSGHASNDTGATAFVASVGGGDSTATTDYGLFTGTPGNLKLVARKGTPAPGATGTSPVFSTTTTSIYDKRINASGQVAFAAAISGGGVDANNDRAFYVWTPNGGTGTLALAAQTGSTAPGTLPTIKFILMDDQVGFNNAGQIAFRSQMTSDVPGEITLANNTGIWAGTPGNLQLVYRNGGPSPIAGLTFRTPEPNPRINASGQVAFFGFVSGSGVNSANDRVLWVTTPGGITAAAREGSQAPGTLAGVNFSTLDPVVAINAPGQLAFTASLLGTGVTAANDRGLWAGLPNDMRLVAREGDEIDLDPGAGQLLKTIQSISFASGISNPVGDSASAAFNDSGAIAWRAQFTDSTTAVLLTTVPGASPSLLGDFNSDGKVDAGDYVTWRKNSGTNNALANDNGLGTPVGPAHYTLWRSNFGNPPGSGTMLPDAAEIPEPSVLLLIGIASFCAHVCRLRSKRR